MRRFLYIGTSLCLFNTAASLIQVSTADLRQWLNKFIDGHMFIVTHLYINVIFSPDLKTIELRRMKGSIMVQWMNLLQNDRSVLQTVSAFIVLKTWPIHLVLVNLMAGRQSDKILVYFLNHVTRFLMRFSMFELIFHILNIVAITSFLRNDFAELFSGHIFWKAIVSLINPYY